MNKQICVDVAYSMGVIAFKKGIMCAPIHDKDFFEVFKNEFNQPIGTNQGLTIKLMKSWTNGWTDANLGKHGKELYFGCEKSAELSHK